ncbi:hypothetical protein CTHBC1_0614 [Acetivibrio thermocellus BC1]|nr:hypothetical protein CTHBC1_0614 [Acetivibrio thermocellus BC1]
MFQFLIGTIQTESAGSGFSTRLWFQFLIGTIQTIFRIQLAVPVCIVSIPHRYDTNQSTIGLLQSQPIVSIPHRYDTNKPFCYGQFTICYLVSIPHRYDTNHHFLFHIILHQQVSIPHRYDTNSDQSAHLPTRALVSIPHRYDTNQVYICSKGKHQFRFNSS